MADCQYTVLEDRGLICITGADARGFLQGLVSNDVEKVTADQALYAALLTPQGKFLHDFFMFEMAGGIWLDCSADRARDLFKRLRMYKLRATVDLADRSGEFRVAVLWGADALSLLGLDHAGQARKLNDKPGQARELGGGVAFQDPRLAALGARAVLPGGDAAGELEALGAAAGDAGDYDALRLSLGIPDGARDMAVEKTILLENGFDELNGVDWNKGCYVGQELTARTKHRGLIKKRLMPVQLDGPVPPPGTPVMADGHKAGEMRSAREGLGLALMRLDRLADGGPFQAGETRVTPKKPDWAEF